MPVPSKERRKFLEQARKQYQEDLRDDAPAVDYLTTTRGLSWDNVTYFRVGVVGNPLPGHENYRGMLAIPYTAPNGDTLSIRFRRLNGDGAKYLTAPGDKPRLFNTSSIERHSDIICVTEGEFDAMVLNQVGLPAMGVPGANTWRKEWTLILKPYRTVYIFIDGDDPGRQFGKTIAEGLSNARIIDLGDGMDVNSYFLENGAEEIMKKVK